MTSNGVSGDDLEATNSTFVVPTVSKLIRLTLAVYLRGRRNANFFRQNCI